MPVAFITGITGQDGSYLAESLASQGVEVHGLVRSHDDRAAEQGHVHPDVILHEGDITNREDLDRIVRSIKPSVIYNLAAVSSVYRSWAEPVNAALVNAVPVAQLLDSAWQLQESTGSQVRFVQASSAELFGQAAESPQTENTPIRPTSPYGAAKAYAHHMVGVYRGRGLFASSCILYNHESPRRPETFVTRKITAAAARIARDQQNTLELGTLDVRRDWGWAPDYAHALELAAASETADDFVIATGQTHSIADFARLAFARAGLDWQEYVSVDKSIARPVDPSEQVGDATRARTVLGWQPTKSFEEIVEAMVDNDLALADSALS
ncbi:GDP-mannose 4,6-dehydratase [Salinibacterium sp. ZJ454]|uniref:GDP-mannose 4,6-dehydratase n=1 Tax=Salinibacterium sp. ZJ454 TaxID=2708339 RepID=UPI0014205A60|nr:GDP-mannose 4,6-dehydratase [Salinibacterium sp. ZJ454]